MTVRFKSMLLGVFILSSMGLNAQNTFFEDLEDVLVDLVYFSDNYVSPAAKASVYQSTGAWFSSAKSLDKFEFDVSVHANVLPVPKKQESFIVSDSDFLSFKIRDASTAEVPTVLGGDTEVFFDFNLGDETYEIQAFDGGDQNTYYYPYIQGSVGLWKQTELTIQYVPKVEINESAYQTFGGAIKHNVSQYWTDSEANDDDFQVAVQVAYSLFDYDIFFDGFEVRRSNAEPNDTSLAVIDGLQVDANAFTSQIIGSKRINNLEFVGSFAVSASTFDYTMSGEGELLLTALNDAFEALEDTDTLIKGSVGANYHFNQWYVASNVSLGTFLNTNVSVHYRF